MFRTLQDRNDFLAYLPELFKNRGTNVSNVSGQDRTGQDKNTAGNVSNISGLDRNDFITYLPKLFKQRAANVWNIRGQE